MKKLITIIVFCWSIASTCSGILASYAPSNYKPNPILFYHPCTGRVPFRGLDQLRWSHPHLVVWYEFRTQQLEVLPSIVAKQSPEFSINIHEPDESCEPDAASKQ